MATGSPPAPPATLGAVVNRLGELTRNLDGKVQQLAAWRQRFMTGDFSHPKMLLEDAELGSIEIPLPPPTAVHHGLAVAIDSKTTELIDDMLAILELTQAGLAGLQQLQPLQQPPPPPQQLPPTPAEIAYVSPNT